MTFGNLARLTALVALTGCITSHEARPEEYVIIRSAGVGYLRVSLDRNEYQSNNEPPTGVQHGSLSDDDWQQVQDLTGDDKMAAYVASSEEDRAGCVANPEAYALNTRKSLGGCWVPASVTDADTKDMLDFFIPLLKAHVPNGDGTPMTPPRDAGSSSRDAGSRDAGRDSGTTTRDAGRDAGK